MTAPSPAALAIAAAAVREHETFGGHIIGRDGILVRFGAVEADVARDEAAGRGVPWRQVMRYWQSLGPLRRARSSFAACRAPSMMHPWADPATSCRWPMRSRACGPRHVGAEREALMQAALRATAVDIPWSAAFVSHVLLSAGVPRTRFAAAIAHLDYVAEAARRSAEEAEGRPATSFYRACDPRRTAMRPGDLLCLHRHDAGSLATGRRLWGPDAGTRARRAPGLEPALRHRRLARQPSRHGDDHRRQRAAIGGAARPAHRPPRRARGRPARPVLHGGARTGPLCRPEAAPWFVLLQAVDPSDP